MSGIDAIPADLAVLRFDGGEGGGDGRGGVFTADASAATPFPEPNRSWLLAELEAAVTRPDSSAEAVRRLLRVFWRALVGHYRPFLAANAALDVDGMADASPAEHRLFLAAFLVTAPWGRFVDGVALGNAQDTLEDERHVDASSHAEPATWTLPDDLLDDLATWTPAAAPRGGAHRRSTSAPALRAQDRHSAANSPNSPRRPPLSPVAPTPPGPDGHVARSPMSSKAPRGESDESKTPRGGSGGRSSPAHARDVARNLARDLGGAEHNDTDGTVTKPDHAVDAVLLAELARFDACARAADRSTIDSVLIHYAAEEAAAQQSSAELALSHAVLLRRAGDVIGALRACEDAHRRGGATWTLEALVHGCFGDLNGRALAEIAYVPEAASPAGTCHVTEALGRSDSPQVATTRHHATRHPRHVSPRHVSPQAQLPLQTRWARAYLQRRASDTPPRPPTWHANADNLPRGEYAVGAPRGGAPAPGPPARWALAVPWPWRAGEGAAGTQRTTEVRSYVLTFS